jgi:hypothetical protein
LCCAVVLIFDGSVFIEVDDAGPVVEVAMSVFLKL